MKKAIIGGITLTLLFAAWLWAYSKSMTTIPKIAR